MLLWFKVASVCGEVLQPNEENLELIQGMFRMTKYLLSISDEAISQGLFSFMKFGRKSFSLRYVTVAMIGINGAIQHLLILFF